MQSKPSVNKKIRIAQIGRASYSHSADIFDALKSHSDVFEIVGYTLPENEKELFKDRPFFFDGYPELTLEEILEDPTIEAVAIETDEIYLTKYALLAAEHGKHIHMEKPGGQSLRDFQKLITIFKSTRKVFHIGYMYRYNPVISEIIKRVKAGEIGEVVSVEAQMSCWHGEEFLRWLSCLDGGMMFYLGCHLIDLVLQLQGLPNKIVPHNCSSKRCSEIDSKDNCFALFEYDRGASFVKTSASEQGGISRRNLVITGTQGRFEICPLEVSIGNSFLYTEYNECISTEWSAKGEWKRSAEYHRYDDMVLSFADMVKGKKENPYTYEYELTLFKTIKKCCE